MPYRIKDPATVNSPVKNVKDVRVLYNGGETPGSFSIAKLKWNGEDVIGVRWNISENEAHDPTKISGHKVCVGEPNSRGNATWFILPEDIILKKGFIENVREEYKKLELQ